MNSIKSLKEAEDCLLTCHHKIHSLICECKSAEFRGESSEYSLDDLSKIRQFITSKRKAISSMIKRMEGE